MCYVLIYSWSVKVRGGGIDGGMSRVAQKIRDVIFFATEKRSLNKKAALLTWRGQLFWFNSRQN